MNAEKRGDKGHGEREDAVDRLIRLSEHKLDRELKLLELGEKQWEEWQKNPLTPRREYRFLDKTGTFVGVSPDGRETLLGISRNDEKMLAKVDTRSPFEGAVVFVFKTREGRLMGIATVSNVKPAKER